MAKTDFDFAGGTNGNASATTVWERYAGNMHAAIADTDGATSAAQGNPVTNSALSDPLPNGVGGTHCRAWSIEDVNPSSGTNSAGIGVALLKSSAGGSLYPVADTPSDGTFVAITQRAFLRVQTYDFVSKSVGNHTSGCANVGFTFKTKDATGNQGGDVYAYGQNQGLHPKYGYHVTLGNAKVIGEVAVHFQSRGGAPRLQIHMTDHASPSNTTSNHSIVNNITNIEYQRDTWYHVRADLIPSVGADIINVYTAPVTGSGSSNDAGLGSETWTLVGSQVIHAGHPAYIPWGSANYDRCGYFGGSYSGISNSSGGRAVAMIDKYQFLAEDIS